jgi:hypothetical protein
MDDFIERQRTWDMEEGRKVRNSIKRIVSFGKEITGGLKRRLSMKRGFEARVERAGSRKVVGRERIVGLRRGRTIVRVAGRAVSEDDGDRNGEE